MNHIGFKEFHKRKSLFFSGYAHQQKFIKDECLARKQAGFAVESVSADEMKKYYNLDAACGILSQKGATSNAYTLTHEILQYCQRKGLKVFDRTKVIPLTIKRKKWL
jgi:glycine/D-amino acid oxidase-like deaminating enzyme